MRYFSILQKFRLLVGIFFTVALIGIVVDIVASNQVSDETSNIAELEIPLLVKSHDVQLAIVQVQQWLTDISATRSLNGLNDGFEKAEQQARLFYQLIDELKRLDPENRAFYAEITPLFKTYYQQGKTMARAYIDHGPEAGNRQMSHFDRAADRLSAKIDTLLDKNQRRVNSHISIQYRLLDSQQFEHLAVYIILLLIIVVMYRIVSRSLQSLPPVIEQLERISQGSLSLPLLQHPNNDEIGALCNGLNEMKEKLSSVIAQVSTSTLQVANAASTTQGVADRSQTSLDQQRQRVEQVTAAITEMSAAIHEIATSAEDAAHSARNADEEARSGHQVVSNTVAVVNNLLNDVVSATEAINQLARDTDSIGSILGVIRGIADQTNLLALNAAIEAARAGESGRGFAVVADEVRTLAQRTQESTEEIQAMIEQLQTGSRNAVIAMEQGRSQVDATVTQAQQAGERLESITRVVANISSINAQVASASEQQKAVVDDMSKHIFHINDSSLESAEGAKSVTHSSTEITELTQGLKQLVSRFQYE